MYQFTLWKITSGTNQAHLLLQVHETLGRKRGGTKRENSALELFVFFIRSQPEKAIVARDRGGGLELSLWAGV